MAAARQAGGRDGQRRRDRRRVAELVAAARRGAGGVPDRRGRLLGRHLHVGAVMLHGLEGRDRPAELLAHLGVLGGLLGALAGHAGRLGGQDHPGQVGEDPAAVRQHHGRRAVEGHPRRPPGRVDVRRDLGRNPASLAIALHSGLDHRHVVTGRDHQDIGELAADHHARAAVRGAVTDRHVTAEPHGAEERAAGQAGQQALLEVGGAEGGDHRTGDHRGHERAGGNGPAQLLDHDHQLGQAEARAVVLLREVQAQPAQVAHLGPEVRQPVGLRLEQRAGRATRAVLAQEVGRGLGQCAVIIGDGDRHNWAATSILDGTTEGGDDDA